jgi:hypothetical protein
MVARADLSQLNGPDRSSGDASAPNERAIMSNTLFGILVLISFVLPVPLLAWLDRPRPKKAG